MPILVNKLIFTIIPQQAPFFVRPLLNIVFNTVNDKMIHPRMKTNAELVSVIILYLFLNFSSSSQIEAHLEKAGDWFAGGDGPTTADFMMGFPLEAWLARDIGVLGPRAKAYVERVHSRYVFSSPKAPRLTRLTQSRIQTCKHTATCQCFFAHAYFPRLLRKEENIHTPNYNVLNDIYISLFLVQQ